MELATLRAFFMWCTVINGGLLIFWTTICAAAPELVYRTQRVWFPISREFFTMAIYGFLAIFKIQFLMFNLVPYLALVLLS